MLDGVELPTPLERAPLALSDFSGRDELWLKREDVHEVGVFKWRSTLPVVKALVAEGHDAVVTSSTGNHGAAVAWACRRLGAKAIVFVPPAASEPKLALLESLEANVAHRGSRPRRGQGCSARLRGGGRTSVFRRWRRAAPVRGIRRDRGRDSRPVPIPPRGRRDADRQRRARRRRRGGDRQASTGHASGGRRRQGDARDGRELRRRRRR